jgi:Fic family protein
LIPVFLYEKKVLSSPMFYMSTYFDKYRDLYLHRLQAISQEGDWNGWINFFLLAVSHQATINAVKTSNILVLYDRMKKEIPETTKSHYATSAIDALFNQPVFKSSDFIQNSGIPKESAMRIIKKLKEKGVLKELRPSRGRRGALLMFEELILIAERAD